MKESKYFYRELSSANFNVFDEQKNIIPVRLKNLWTKDFYYFDNSDSCWKTSSLITNETVTDSNGETVQGYPVEFSEYPIGNYAKGGVSDICGESKVNNFFDYSPREMELYLLEHRDFSKRRAFYSKNAYDTDGYSKDCFGVCIETDDKKSSMEITFYVFDRRVFEEQDEINHKKHARLVIRKGLEKMVNEDPDLFNHLYDYNSEKPDIRENKLIINLSDGSFNFASKTEWPLTKEGIFYWEDAVNWLTENGIQKKGEGQWFAILDRLTELQKIIPKYIQSEILNRLIVLAKKRFNVSYDTGNKVDKDNLLVSLYKITKLPYEPNLYQVINNDFIIRIKPFSYNRNDSLIFKKFCRKYHIKQYRFLRHCYEKKPEILIIFLKMWRAGFRDINNINKVLESDEYYELIEGFDEVSFYFFCKYCIKRRGELSVLNMLLSGKDTLWVKKDTMFMFHQYFKLMPEQLRDDIVKNGLTSFNHEALSKFSYTYENRKIEYKYSRTEKKLEDEIDGYSFKLPTDSYELRDIGAALHNCVASYAEQVDKRKCLIVYAQKDEKYKLCIEIKGKSIKQQRADHNAAPEESEMRILEKWQKRHGLTVRSEDLL